MLSGVFVIRAPLNLIVYRIMQTNKNASSLRKGVACGHIYICTDAEPIIRRLNLLRAK